MDELRAVGVARLKLAQGRFGNGALYISAIYSASEFVALDVRFFAEKDRVITPTPSGFRVPIADLDSLAQLACRKPEQVGELTLWARKKRKLVARWCDDKYGVGVDIRHYKTSAEYEGWEKRGIRLVDDDFSKVMQTILRSGLLEKDFTPKGDVFKGCTWNVGSGATQRAPDASNQARESSGLSTTWSTPVALALDEFLRGSESA